MAIDLSINLNGFKLQNPILSASGTYGYNSEFDEFCNVKRLGAVVTKAITLAPRDGNDWARIIETDAGMINSIGLENLGIEKFITEKIPVLNSKNINYIMNLAGSSKEEYIELAKIAEKAKIKAIELNVSCPNVKEGCIEFGSNEKALSDLISSIKYVYNGFIVTKLTPNVANIEELAQAAEKAGSNAITAINTIKGLGLNLTCLNGKFTKYSVQGGYSGKAIKPIALANVYRISKVVNIPIIGCGGIYSVNDILEFFAVGADAVEIGTANFTHPDICEKLIDGLTEFMGKNNFRTVKELKKELREVM